MPSPARNIAFAAVGREPEPDLAELLLDTVPRAMAVIRGVVRQFASCDRAMLHFRVVTQLLERPCTTGELAELTGAAPANISKVIAPMGRANLVARSHDPRDRRFVHIELTPSGRAQALAMLVAVRAELSDRLASLSRGQRQILAQGASCLAQAFGPTGAPERKHS